MNTTKIRFTELKGVILGTQHTYTHTKLHGTRKGLEISRSSNIHLIGGLERESKYNEEEEIIRHIRERMFTKMKNNTNDS